MSRLPLHGALPYLTDAYFAGVCTRLEALSWLILPTLMLTVLLEGEGWRVGGWEGYRWGGIRVEQNQGTFRLATMPGVGFFAPWTLPNLRDWSVYKNGGHPAQGSDREMLTGSASLPPTASPLPRHQGHTGASRAAVTGPLVGLGAGGGTLDAGTGDDTLMTHAGGAGAVGGLPATAFGVLLPMEQAACVRGGRA